jgi:CheY-like chemotaxis protein
MPDHAPLVLIIDDDDDSRYVYSRLLAHRGYEVAEAVTGSAGIRLAQSAAPALIIMDYLLPGMTGWDATRLLKADPLTAHIPVVNVTACTYDGIADDARAAGCDEFIAKPCDPFDVIHAVARLIGATGSRVPTPRRPMTSIGEDAAVA